VGTVAGKCSKGKRRFAEEKGENKGDLKTQSNKVVGEEQEDRACQGKEKGTWKIDWKCIITS